MTQQPPVTLAEAQALARRAAYEDAEVVVSPETYDRMLRALHAEQEREAGARLLWQPFTAPIAFGVPVVVEPDTVGVVLRPRRRR